MMEIINGKLLAEKIKHEVAQKIVKLGEKRPNLAIILIGEREDSKLYVSLKEKEAKKVGIDTHIYRCESDISEKEVLDTINFLNNDENIDAILVQLPLPEGLDTDKIIRCIDCNKDVDCFHPENLKDLDCTKMLSPVYGTVIEMLDSIDYELENKSVCIIANSDIFGKNLEKVLKSKEKSLNISVVKANDKDLEKKTSSADILITAVGKPEFIKKEMVKENAVVIDVGITTEEGDVYGDVDFRDVENKVAYITPVPGGVGPMTIAMLFKNTLELFEKKK